MFHQHRVRLVSLWVALALVLTATACGGSSNKASPPSSTPSTSATTTGTAPSATTTTSVDRTALVMTSGLLRATDLPTTWKDSGKSSASATDAAEIALAKSIPACRDFARAVKRENGQTKMSSNKFVDSTASPSAQGEVSNDVVAWPTIADAKSAYAAYSAGVMKSCLQTLFRKILSQQGALKGLVPTISVENLPVPAVGDAVVGYQATVQLASGSKNVQVGFIVEIVRVSRYTVSYNATLYKSSPSGFGKNLVVRSIARLESAPSS